MTTEVDPISARGNAAPRSDPYQPGPSSDEVRLNGALLRRGDSGDGVRELQRLLNAGGASPPLVTDGLFGPKTEAAVRARLGKSEVDASSWSSLLRESTDRTRDPNAVPTAPKLGAKPPDGSITAGTLQREDEARRLSPPSGQTSGAPPGYHTMTGRIPPAVVAKARTLLRHDYGTEIPFEIDGKRYLARLEHHYHPPGYIGGPNGWHKGVTVYEAQ